MPFAVRAVGCEASSDLLRLAGDACVQCSVEPCNLRTSKCRDAPDSQMGYVCVCDKGWTGPDCDTQQPLNCTRQHSKHHCENVSAAGGQIGWPPLPPCKWVTARSECVALRQPGSHGMPQDFRPATDVAEVGLFGFPEFENVTELSGNLVSYTLTEAIERPVYTAFNSRKVDVGNPMFGPISAVFAPDFMRNMTLIAPIDTGAWEGECNSSYGGAGLFQPNYNPCAKIETESQCNVWTGTSDAEGNADQKLKVCDWREGRCVDTAIERKECRMATTQHDCEHAPGPDSPYEQNGFDQHLSRAQLFAAAVFDSGCSWNATSVSPAIACSPTCPKHSTRPDRRQPAATLTAHLRSRSVTAPHCAIQS
eukprot:SAG31_NODE_831_length_11669_cov_3.410026_3_plen_365_part_00